MEKYINMEKTQGEEEEDLLEYIYRLGREGREISATEYGIENDVGGKDSAKLVRGLVKKRYLEESSKKGKIKLTEKGYLKGLDCLIRHEKLTQFLQMVSGMSQERAEEDACRMEHYISPEAIKGIGNFLQFGDIYDRTYEKMDLYTEYGIGEFEMKMGIYELERRNPRVLAEEYKKFQPFAILKVEEEKNWFLLEPVNKKETGYVWYKRRENWMQAEKEKNAYKLPADIFTYMVNATVPITEAKAVVAFTEFKEVPGILDCREINIHIW